MKYIVKVGENLDLTKKERANLEKFKESMPLLESYDYKIEHYKKLRQDPTVVRRVRGTAIKVLEVLFQKTDFGYSLNKKGIEIGEESITRVVLDIACQYLELNYDEDFAKKVMTMLLAAKPNDVRDRYLFQLGFWTEYQFDQQEEKQIREILATTNIDIKKLSYEEILAEKQRVVREREDMMRSRSKPVREFKFE